MNDFQDSARAVSSASPIGEADAHGQAALFLAESILHTIVDRGLITPHEAQVTVQVAAEVKREVAESAGESPERISESLRLLAAIEKTFAAYDGAARD